MYIHFFLFKKYLFVKKYFFSYPRQVNPDNSVKISGTSLTLYQYKESDTSSKGSGMFRHRAFGMADPRQKNNWTIRHGCLGIRLFRLSFTRGNPHQKGEKH